MRENAEAFLLEKTKMLTNDFNRLDQSSHISKGAIHDILSV